MSQRRFMFVIVAIGIWIGTIVSMFCIRNLWSNILVGFIAAMGTITMYFEMRAKEISDET